MRAQLVTAKKIQAAGFTTVRYGLALNLLSIGRLKFEDYEVENIRAVITHSPLFSRLVAKFGARKVARAIGVTEIAIAALIAAKPLAPRASALGSLATTGMFATTLSFLATTPEAWHQTHPEPKLSPAGQFLVKDFVLLGASLLTLAESMQARRLSKTLEKSRGV